MRRTRLRLVLACLASAMVCASFFAPAAVAQSDVDSARSAIWATVQGADAQNQQLLNQFTADALAATSMDELHGARDTAHWKLDVVWYGAVDDIEAIRSLYPDDLGDDADAALAVLVRDHDGAHAEVEQLYRTIADALGTTTTTTTTKPPSVSTTTTTTTTKPPSVSTTTTTRPSTTSTSTTTTRPPTSTTSTTTSTTTTVPSEVVGTTTTTRPTTTTTEAGGGVPPGGGSDTPAISDDPALDRETVLATGTGGDEPAESAVGDVRAERTPATHMLMHTASVVLPPGLVEFAMSPFMAIEFLAWTLVEAIGSMLLPFLVLMAAVAWTAWREIRRPAAPVN
jgi:hypothetical protein